MICQSNSSLSARDLLLPLALIISLVATSLLSQNAQAAHSAAAIELFQAIDRAALKGPVIRIQSERMTKNEARWLKSELKSTLRAMAQSCDDGDAETFLYHIEVANFTGFFPAIFRRVQDRSMVAQELMTYLCDNPDVAVHPSDTRAGKCEEAGCSQVRFRGRKLIPNMGSDGVVRFLGLGECALDVCRWPVGATRIAYNRWRQSKGWLASR